MVFYFTATGNSLYVAIQLESQRMHHLYGMYSCLSDDGHSAEYAGKKSADQISE